MNEIKVINIIISPDPSKISLIFRARIPFFETSLIFYIFIVNKIIRMKKLYSTLFLIASLSSLAIAQDWKDVAGIFYARCTTCHNPGGQPLEKFTTFHGTYPWVSSIATDAKT